jgi:ankyrin repeat protein
MDSGAEINARDSGSTPLHMASMKVTAIAMALPRQGGRYRCKDGDDATALHLASCNGHTEIAMALIEGGADVGAVDSSGRNSFTQHHMVTLRPPWLS